MQTSFRSSRAASHLLHDPQLYYPPDRAHIRGNVAKLALKYPAMPMLSLQPSVLHANYHPHAVCRILSQHLSSLPAPWTLRRSCPRSFMARLLPPRNTSTTCPIVPMRPTAFTIANAAIANFVTSRDSNPVVGAVRQTSHVLLHRAGLKASPKCANRTARRHSTCSSQYATCPQSEHVALIYC